MKPAFALDLSQDGLTLLYRLEDGWAALGSVDFDAPDIEARLAGLRARAEALAPSGITTKLILPESQILYFEVAAPGPDTASRRAQIAAALEGRTPYPVADLAFDWSRAGAAVQAAVVARVTLAEAEGFAEAQGFNPVSFVARPAPGRFAGEPFFGPAARAADHLPEGARLDRDQDPVRIVALPPSLATAPAAPTAPAESAAIELIEPSQPDGITETLIESAGSNIGSAKPVEVAPVTAGITAEPLESVQELQVTPPAGIPATSRAAEPEPAGEAPFIAVDDLADDAMAEPAAAFPDGTGTADAGPPPAPSFASRRRIGEPTADPATLLAEATVRLHLLADAPAAARSAPRLGPAAAGPAITAPAIDLPASGTDAEAREHGEARRRGPARTILTDLPEARHGTQAQLRERRASPDTPSAAGIFGAPSGAARRAAPGRTRLGLALGAALVLLMAAVAFLSLWFGADPEPQAALPMPSETALAQAPTAVAAPTDAEAGAVTATGPEPAPAVTTAPEADQPAEAPEARAADTATPAEPADAVAEAITEALAPEEDAAAVPPTARTVTPPPVWTGAPQGSAAGPDDATSGAAALAATAEPGRAELPEAPGALAAGPAAASSDAEPDAQPLPPPFGTVITFGPDGRIVPTPEGVITPDGFTLFAGRPPLAPVPAPRADAAAAAAAPTGTPAIAEPAALPLPAPVDPAHAARQPSARPQAIVERAAAARAAAPSPAATDPLPVTPPANTPGTAPPAATEGALPPPVDPAHAALGPKVRPAAVAARAEAIRAQATAIAAAAEAAARAEAEALASASRLAVASSRRPTERPSGLAKAVEAAVAAAVATPPTPEPEPEPTAAPAPPPEPVVASAPAPAEIDEPEPTEAVPDMPTTVTVARQATVKNAIDLGKINLIGVYGSSGSRRALIRMPTGRLVKVKIGDRLDGGQVAAIGDSEVTYVKGGRSFTLKIQKNG